MSTKVFSHRTANLGYRCLWPWLPSGHPAMHWTTGTVPERSCIQSPTFLSRHHIHYGFGLGPCSTIPGFRSYHHLLSRNREVVFTSVLDSTDWSFRKRLKQNKPLSGDRICGLHKNVDTQDQKLKRHLSFSSLSPQAIVNASPVNLQPYLKLVRLDKPIGTWLLYMPCMWSIGLSAAPGHLPDVTMLTLFGLGSLLMRGAGCIINDMWDKDFDKKVTRTRTRPLACGDLNYFQALCCLGLHLSASLAILLTFNWYSVILGATSMFLVVTYPLMKRYTYWPQIMLGLAFNWGALLGWSAVRGECDWAVVLPLYMAGIAWTLVYDTIYAHQDKEYDMLIGVKSTALKFGDQTKYWLSGFGTLMVGNLALCGLLCDASYPYFVGVTFVAAHLARQLYTVDLDNPSDCLEKFKSNKNLGLVLFAFIVASSLMKKRNDTKEDKQETEH